MFRRAIPLALLGLAGASLLAIALSARDSETSQLWASVYVEAVEAEHYESLEAMRDAADAVVVGRIVSTAAGRVFGDPPEDFVQYVTAVVEIDRLLSGSVEEIAPGALQLEIMVSDPAQMDDVLRLAPRSESVFFLRHKATEAERLGAPPEVVAAETKFYRLVTLRGVVWNESGLAAAHQADHDDFLTELAGRPFEEVVMASTP